MVPGLLCRCVGPWRVRVAQFVLRRVPTTIVVIPSESSAYHYVNTSDRIGHPGHRRTDHNRRLLGIGHRGKGHDSRLISFGFRCGSGRRLGGSHRHGADDPVIVVARYPDFGRIVARPNVSMYS